MNAEQSTAQHFGLEEEGIGKSGIAEKEDYSLLECTAPLQEQALPAVNAEQAIVQHIGHSRRGIGSSVLDEETQLSPVVRTGPPERLTQTAGHAGDSMVRRVGVSAMRRSAPRRVADAPQLQTLLEDLGDSFLYNGAVSLWYNLFCFFL